MNICIRDMERSIRFYQDPGFTKVNDFTLDDPSVGDALGLKAKKLRGVFMRLGVDPGSPVLDLVQFIDPPPPGQRYPTLNNIGICRIAFSVDDIDRAYADLLAKKVQFARARNRNGAVQPAQTQAAERDAARAFCGRHAQRALAAL